MTGWTGSSDASGAAFARVPKPTLLDIRQWPADGQQVRAEPMTYVPDSAISTDMILRARVALPASWWHELQRGLSEVAAMQDTKRVITGDEVLRHQLLAAFGFDPDLDLLGWCCAHGDLHWGNLTAPRLWLLDWEHWGWAPQGYDPAVLYCASILVPDLAGQVHEQFADQVRRLPAKIELVSGVQGEGLGPVM